MLRLLWKEYRSDNPALARGRWSLRELGHGMTDDGSESKSRQTGQVYDAG